MILIVWFIIESVISGYRDMARFFQKGTWGLEIKVWWVPYWEVKYGSKLDPFHFAGGTMWALIIILLFFEAIYHYLTHELFVLSPVFVLGSEWYLFLATLAVHGVVAWIGFYWVRDIMMHVVGIKKEYRRNEFLIPLPVRWVLEKLKILKY